MNIIVAALVSALASTDKTFFIKRMGVLNIPVRKALHWQNGL